MRKVKRPSKIQKGNPPRDLGQIRGVGPQRSRQLSNAGVTSCKRMASIRDLKALSNKSGIQVGMLERFRYSAQALEGNLIFRVNPFELGIENVMFLDIETNHGCTNAWLIGTLLNGTCYQFYADTLEEENRILREFKQMVEKTKPKIICSYSGMGFDQRILLEGFHRFRIQPPHALKHCHVDLLSEIQRSFIFPSPSYGLKKLGTVFGYQFQHGSLDGYQVALAYQHHIKYGEPIDLRVFEYNKDDVYALQYLIQYIHQPTNHKLQDLPRKNSTLPKRKNPRKRMLVDSPVPKSIPKVDHTTLESLFSMNPKNLKVLHQVGVQQPRDLLEIPSKVLTGLRSDVSPQLVDLWLQQAAHWMIYDDEGLTSLKRDTLD